MKNRMTALVLAGIALLAVFSGMQSADASGFLPDQMIVSTVPPNGDVNPYGVAFVPKGFQSGTGPLRPGDILVSNFNNSMNLQGTGTTIVRVSASGAVSTFFTGTTGLGLSTALAVLQRGFVIVGNEQVAIGRLSHSEWTMQVNRICVNNRASASTAASRCRVLHCKHSVVFCGCHIKHIQGWIVYQAGRPNYERSGIASVLVSGCDHGRARDRHTIRSHIEVQSHDRPGEDIRDKGNRVITLVKDGHIPWPINVRTANRAD